MIGIWMYFETIYACRNIHYVEIPKVGSSTRMHRVYQNLDNMEFKHKICHSGQ